MNASPLERLFLGSTCALLGIAGVVAFFLVELPDNGGALALWPLVLWTGGWLLMAAMLFELPRRLLGRRWPGVDFDDLGGGAFLLFAGGALALVPWLDTRDGAFPAGRLVVGLAGMLFALGGAWVAHHAWFGPRGSDTRFSRVLVALIVTLFAGVVGLVAGWLAFSPPRPSLWWIPLPGALLLAFLAVNAWRDVFRR